MERNRRAGKGSNNEVRPRRRMACDARQPHPVHQLHAPCPHPPTPLRSTFPTTEPGSPWAAHRLRRGPNAGEAQRMSGAFEAASIQRAVSSVGTQAGRGAALARRPGMGTCRRGRRHGQTVSRPAEAPGRAGPARRRAGPRTGPAIRLVAERGVAHQRFEAAQRLALLGRASGDEPRAVAEAAEGERQGPQERAGEAFDELDGEPGEVGTGGHEQKARRGGADDVAHVGGGALVELGEEPGERAATCRARASPPGWASRSRR